MADGQQSIDLSAGITPAAPAAATPPAAPQGSPNIDLSAGIVPQPDMDLSAGVTPTRQPDPFLEGLTHLYTPADVESAKGFIKSAGQTAETVAGWLPGQTAANAARWLQQRDQIRNNNQQAGADLENVVEFLGGDELLKGASLLTKMNELKPIAAALDKSPVITRIIGNALRLGTVGATQNVLHGGTPTTATEAGLISGVGGGAAEAGIEGVAKLRELLAPSVTDILGEQTPVLASQRPGATSMAESVAPIRTEPQIANQQQQAFTTGVANRAQQVARSMLHEINASRLARWREGEAVMNLAPESTAPQLPSGQTALPPPRVPQIEGGAAPTGIEPTAQVGPYEGEFAEQPPAQPSAAGTTPPPGQRVSFVEQGPPNFAPVDVDSATQGIRNFGDAARVVRQHAQPVFAALDDATGGEYSTLRRARDAAYAAEDYNGVRNAENSIDDLFNWHDVRGRIDKFDYNTAKSIWRKSKVLDATHNAVSRAFNIPDEELARRAGDVAWRGISGRSLQNGVNRLVDHYGLPTLDEVLGPTTMDGLTRAASLTQSAQSAARYGEKVDSVVNGLTGLPGVREIPATVNWARRMLLHGMATSPRISNFIDYIHENRIAPAVYRPMLAAMLGMFNRRTTPPPTGGQ